MHPLLLFPTLSYTRLLAYVFRKPVFGMGLGDYFGIISGDSHSPKIGEAEIPTEECSKDGIISTLNYSKRSHSYNREKATQCLALSKYTA